MSEVDENLLEDDINIIDDIEEVSSTDDEQTSAPAEGGEVETSTDDEQTSNIETPSQPEPLTAESVRSIIQEIRDEERQSFHEKDDTYRDIEQRFYPEGISKVMVDKATGREIRTAQDVIDLAKNPDLTIEEAERWRLVKQAEWDANVRDIENSIRTVAEQTIELDRGAQRLQSKYGELFKAYPELERRVTQQYTKTLDIDPKTRTVLRAPIDIEEYYSSVLEPYRIAFEANTRTVQTPTPAPTPTKDDRLDEPGDGGESSNDDPNDFEAQLRKEFSI